MRTFDIVDTIVLGFLTHNDSYDAIIDPNGICYLMFDDNDIIFVNGNGDHITSITTNNAIDIWLRQGKIRERK